MKLFGKSKSIDPKHKQGKTEQAVVPPTTVEPAAKTPVVVPVIKQEEKTVMVQREDEKQASGLFTRFQKKGDALPEQHELSEKTVIGKSVIITGEVSGSEEIQVDGRVDGDICIMSKIGIGISGVVEGKIDAQEVRVSGKVRGEIKARGKIDISATGDIEGSVTTPRFIVADGATIQGLVTTAQPRIKDVSPVIDRNLESDKRKHSPEMAIKAAPGPSPQQPTIPNLIPADTPPLEKVAPKTTETSRPPLEATSEQAGKAETPKEDVGEKRNSAHGNVKNGKKH